MFQILGLVLISTTLAGRSAGIMGTTGKGISWMNRFLDKVEQPIQYTGPTGFFTIKFFPERVIWEKFYVTFMEGIDKSQQGGLMAMLFQWDRGDIPRPWLARNVNEAEMDILRAARRVWEKNVGEEPKKEEE